MSSVNSEKLEEKIGEAIGLEMAAQKAVEELNLKGLIPNVSYIDKSLI
jgi:hypothetical protein